METGIIGETGDADAPRLGSPSIRREAAKAFFLPGVGGDDLEFEDLNARIGEHLRLIPVDYPAAGARGTVLSSMALTAEVVASDIMRQRPSGGIALVGYSFGGSLALEVAHQLAGAGRTVDLLCILDAPFRMEELSGLFAALRLATAPRRVLKKVVEAAANAEVTLKLVSQAASPSVIGLNRAEPVRRALLTHLRTKALAGWTPPPCPSPGLLICTGVLGDANRDRWMALCPALTYLGVTGDHERLLMGESLDAIAVALIGAVNERKLGAESADTSGP